MFYRRALGLGLVLTAARTPRIAPRVAVRGRGYVARIKGISDLGSGSRPTRRAGTASVRAGEADVERGWLASTVATRKKARSSGRRRRPRVGEEQGMGKRRLTGGARRSAAQGREVRAVLGRRVCWAAQRAIGPVGISRPWVKLGLLAGLVR